MTEQQQWLSLCKDIGEDAAKKELVRQLRLVADIIEQEGYPDVFSAEMLPNGSEDLPDFIEKVSVTLSYPWPG